MTWEKGQFSVGLEIPTGLEERGKGGSDLMEAT